MEYFRVKINVTNHIIQVNRLYLPYGMTVHTVVTTTTTKPIEYCGFWKQIIVSNEQQWIECGSFILKLRGSYVRAFKRRFQFQPFCFHFMCVQKGTKIQIM